MDLVRLDQVAWTPAVEEAILCRISATRAQLAEARGVADAQRVFAVAAAVLEWLKRQAEASLGLQNEASLFKLETEHRMGGFLREPGTVAERGRPEKTSVGLTFSPPTHSDLGITREAARCYRLVSTVPLDTIRQTAVDATRRGVELTRATILKLAGKPVDERSAKAATPIPLMGSLANGIHTGDARELAALLPDGSVTLCLCDPVYKQVEDYAWLAKECERVLAPGGSVVAQCSNLLRFECEVAMRRSALEFVDLIAEVYPYALCALWKTRVQVGWKPYLWLSKGPWKSWGDRENEWIVNRIHAGGKRKADESKELHEWGDSEEFASGLIGKLCGPAGLIWDPFTGSGVVPAAATRLGIPFVAFEIHPAMAEKARQRVAGTPSQAQNAQGQLAWDEAAA